MTNRAARLLALLLIACVTLTGCNIFRRGRAVQAEPPPPFSSPITEAVGRPGMTLPDITAVLAERQADTRSILGTLSIVVGEARSNTRMQFDANMYFAPPDLLRLRGTADAGTLFDFLMLNGQATVLLVPEKKAHVGTVDRLRRNPTVMAGIQPDDLMYSFLAEQNLYRSITGGAQVQLREAGDHYEILVPYPSGVSETFRLRMSDLLIDGIQRKQGRRNMGSVRFDGYAFYDVANDKSKKKKKHLLPTRFEAQLPSGGVATVESRDLQPNAPRNEDLTRVDIPADFQQQAL